jgi:hypothetical protein
VLINDRRHIVHNFDKSPAGKQKAPLDSSPSKISPMTMVSTNLSLPILHNNAAVDHFKAGNLVKAFETLQHALRISELSKQEETTSLMNYNNDYHHHKKWIFRYHWDDCFPTYSSCGHSKNKKNSSSSNTSDEICLNEGTSSLLCLWALKISIPPHHYTITLDGLRPCGYAWVIWYNLALVSNFMGTRLGEKGYGLLWQAHGLLQRVPGRIDNTDYNEGGALHHHVSHDDWSLLQMAVLNNQACIFHELAMMSKEETLVDYEEYLDNKLGEIFRDWEVLAEGKHRDAIFLHLMILSSGHVLAPAA